MIDIRPILIAIALSLAIVAPASGQPSTYPEIHSLAERGDHKAQAFLCIYYHGAAGGPVDFEKSLYWCDQAARNGNSDAQYDMGIKYQNGIGVTKSRVFMYMWWQIARMDCRGDRFVSNACRATSSMRSAEEYMTPSQISEGKRLASVCLSSGFQLCGPKPPTSTNSGSQSLAAVAPASGQDYRRGFEAAERGDHATALGEWRPLAEQGHP